MNSVPLGWSTEVKLHKEVSLEYYLDRNTTSEDMPWGKHREIKFEMCSMDSIVVPGIDEKSWNGLMRALESHKSFIFYTTVCGDHGRSIEPNGIMKGKNGLSKGQTDAVFISTVKRFHQPHPLSLYPAFLSRGRERVDGNQRNYNLSKE